MIVLNLLLVSLLSFAEFTPPNLTQPVMDQADLLNRSDEQKLNQLLRQVHDSNGPQFAILTVPSLNGSSLFDASFKTAEKWKLGSEKQDNGLLIFIAKKERKIRIEVGQGLEGTIPDAISKRAINQIMTPYFKQGRFSEGIYLATTALLKRAAPNLKIESNTQGLEKSSRRSSSSSSFFDIIFLVIGLIIFIFNPRLFLYGLLLGGGRGGFGGRGGGGFSGGGGGFSGGGASGGW